MSHLPLLSPAQIDVFEWLAEVGLPQYEETFSVNFARGGVMLSRRRLEQVRLQDFPNMNITSFEHQKIILQHIKAV